MARIPYANPPAGSRAANSIARAPMNISRVLAHSEKGMEVFSHLGVTILTKTSLDPVLRELAILRVGHMLGSIYETFQHERIGRAVGMSEAQIEASRTGDASTLGDDERLVIAFAEEMQRTANVSDATFDKAKARFTSAQLVELGVAVGYYGMVSRFLNTFQVPVEDNPVDILANANGR